MQLNDPVGEATAKMNIADLKKILNIPDSPEVIQTNDSSQNNSENCANNQHLQRIKRESMEQLSLIKVY